MRERETEREGDKGAEEELGEGGPLLLATTARHGAASRSSGIAGFRARSLQTRGGDDRKVLFGAPCVLFFFYAQVLLHLNFLFYK